MILRTSLLLAAGAALVAGDARYEQITAAVAQGFSPQYRTLTAGRWGTAAAERALAGAFQADGSALIAMAWQGGTPPAGGRLIGDDQSSAGDAAQAVDPVMRTVSGGIMRLAADGGAIAPLLRFGRGTGVPTAISILGDTVVVAGCGDRAALARLGKARELPAADAKSGGGNGGERWDATFVMGLSADLSSMRWLLIGPGGAQPSIGPWKSGVLLIGAPGVVPIDSAGTPGSALPVSGPGRTRWLASNERGDLAAFGDVNTHTNREPYRNPFLHLFDSAGKRTASWWSFEPKSLGSDTANNWASDSSPRAVAWGRDGDLYLGGWSDGGNSVFFFHPTRFLGHHGKYEAGFIPSIWGMGVGGLGHVLRIDPKTATVRAATFLIGFVPNDPQTFTGKRDIGRPNTLVIRDLHLLGDGALVITGKAATGLIETPDAWWRYPGKGRMGGEIVSVLSPDLAKLRFATYLPTVADVVAVADDRRILLLGASTEKHGKEDLPAPAVKPLAKGYGGGGSDAFVALLQAAR